MLFVPESARTLSATVNTPYASAPFADVIAVCETLAIRVFVAKKDAIYF